MWVIKWTATIPKTTITSHITSWSNALKNLEYWIRRSMLLISGVNPCASCLNIYAAVHTLPLNKRQLPGFRSEKPWSTTKLVLRPFKRTHHRQMLQCLCFVNLPQSWLQCFSKTFYNNTNKSQRKHKRESPLVNIIRNPNPQGQSNIYSVCTGKALHTSLPFSIHTYHRCSVCSFIQP